MSIGDVVKLKMTTSRNTEFSQFKEAFNMGMTMTQKILAAHAGLESVEAGQLIEAKLDVVMANDITGPMALPIIKQMSDHVFDKDKVVFVPDHFTPNKDIKSAENSKAIREYAKEQGLTWYFEQGKSGVEHAILPEAGVVVAGECIIGADSHTCTYGALGAFSTGMGTTDVATGMATGEIWFKVPSAIKFVLTGKPGKYVSGKDIIIHIIGKIGVDGALYKSMEFTGDGIANLSMDDRFTMANMAIEAGAKNGIFPVDEKAEAYMKEHSKKPYTIYEADEDAQYDEVITIDLSEVRPTVAFPHLPGNAKTIDEVEAMEPIKIDQVVIGSCTNGRMEDMRKAAAILKGHTVHPDVRVMVIPATQKIYKECIKEGRGMRGQHTELRSVYGRTHGSYGGRRKMRVHNEQKLRRTYGPCGFPDLSCVAGSGCCKRDRRIYCKSGESR